MESPALKLPEGQGGQPHSMLPGSAESNLVWSRRIACAVGALFIIGTVAGIASAVITGPILGDPAYLTKVAAAPNSVMLGALCLLTMCLSLVLIPAVVFPVLRSHNEVLALGYVVYRGALETGSSLVTVISWLLMVAVSRESMAAAPSATPHFQTLGKSILSAAEIGASTTAIVFPLGAMMLYTVFYRAKLIPRWLSVWGLIAVTLYLFGMGLATMFGLGDSISAFQWAFFLPTLVQEMVMAVWLIAVGFNPSALTRNREQWKEEEP